MRSNGPLANKKVAMGGRGWPGGLVASWPGHSSRLAESGRLVRRMSHRVDPAAIAEEARTVRLRVGGRAGQPADPHCNASFAAEVQTNSRLQRV